MVKRFTQKGFSLLELMMVVLIIGVAAATVRLAVSGSDPLDQAQATAETFIYWYSQQQDFVLMSPHRPWFIFYGIKRRYP